ncbi:hypothetical protein FSP39_007337 [Pinctada imbricata]|uniref:RING-type domain-containing protein n=1 Tax=Pinctada imbricata TaxID=66713 RepID=A0AA88XS22_PINIB|nr:hypothetical protein FSP39_007337 [Pinctada imbricata]
MSNRPVSALSLRSKIREDHLTCTICFAPFETPKALPCLHTFDEDCLRDYVESQGYGTSGQFPCPVCRKMTAIPAGGISALPDNHLVKSLNDTIEKQRPPVPPRPTASPSAPDIDQMNSPSPVPMYPSVPDNPSTLPHSAQVPSTAEQNLLLQFGKYGGTIGDLQKPYGLAIGKRGEYVVSDSAGNRILIFANAGEMIGRFSCTDCKVGGVAITKDNNVLVAVRGAGSAIARTYNFDGRVLQNIGNFYRYDKPSGITLNSKNQIIVTNLEGDNVYILTEQHKMSKKFGWKGSGNQHFDSPNFVTVDSKDNIIVSDNGNDCIKMYNHSGEFIRKIGDRLECPMGVAVDNHDNILVADAGNFRVQAYNHKGNYLSSIVENTDLIGPDVKPINVAVTQRNNVVVLLRGTQYAEIRVYVWKGK